MATKAYFIGLGGCGLKTVAELSKKFGQQDMTDPEFLYTYIDTDGSTLNKINTDGPVISNQDFINLGDTNPFQVYKKNIGSRTPEAVRLKEWMIEQGKDHEFTLSNSALSDGASAQRMVGRTAMFYKYGAIESEFRRKIAVFQRNNNNNNTTVDANLWVFASSCGGTGSSLILDALYLLNRLVNETMGAAPNLKLVLFMPEPFIEANRGNSRYRLNAFSAMWELNAFRLDKKQGKGDRFNRFAVVPSDTSTGEWELYRYIIPVDLETNFNTKIPFDSLYSTVAEMIYYWNKGNVANSMIANLCNDIKELDGVTAHDDTPFEWTQTLIACGYHVLKKANKEFKEYIKTRGIYEVLKYGLLGLDIPEDSEVRNKAQMAFAQEYILPHLCELGDYALSVNSVQSAVEAKYDEVRKPMMEGFDKIRGNRFMSQLESVEEDFEILKKGTFESLKKSINQGISKTIKEHGLLYTWTVLNLVDDFYLEPLCKNKLVSLRKEREDCVRQKQSECQRLLAGNVNKKSIPAIIKTLEEYRSALKEYNSVKLSIALIMQLTEYPDGYLELIRKGGGTVTGLRQVIEKTTEFYGVWEDAFRKLAKEFRETDKDSLTVYLPDLKEIATGDNTDWSVDNLFDRLYCHTVLDYDRRQKEARVPVRKNEGINNLSSYIETIDKSSSLFVELALSDVFEFKKNFEKKIIQPLSRAVLEVVEKDGTLAKAWLDKTLEESLEDSDMLPKGETKEKFLSRLGTRDRIPVLYPVSPGATNPSLLRFLYAGASRSLAAQLGYVDNESTCQFVLDSAMEDRFLIFKIPVGLDFFSYKYFNDIQSQYFNHQKKVKEGGYGCHIHKEFAQLDIDKAIATLDRLNAQSYLYYFFKSLYYQNVIYLLKKKKNAVYKEVFGCYSIDDVLNGTDSVEPEDTDIIDLSVFGGDDEHEEELVLSWDNADISDTFIHLEITNRLSVTLREIKQDDENHAIVVSEDVLSFETTQLIPCSLFVKSLASQNCLDVLKTVDVLEAYMNANWHLSEAVKEVSDEAKKEIRRKGTRQDPKIAVFIEAWMKQQKIEERNLLKFIIESIFKF